MLIRVSVLFISAPVIGNARVPSQLKIALSLIVTLLLYLSMKGGHLTRPVPGNIFALASAAAGEAFIGLLVGYSAYLLFTGIQMAGQVIDIQIGFGLVNVIDPAGGQSVSILGQFYYMVAMLFFLAINGHHLLLKAVGDSFQLLPPGSVGWFDKAAGAGPLLSEFFTKLFIIAFQVAAPSVAVLFLTSVSMGLLSRTLPQMNIFIVGLPLNVALGLLVTILSLKLMGSELTSVVAELSSSAYKLLHALAA
jgi:flagellar biosynthetic protein FliR